MHKRFRIALSTIAATALTGGLIAVAAPPVAVAAAALYADDFNGDGYRDNAIAWNTTARAGAVKIVFGTATGPGTETQVIHQGSPGVPGANEEDDAFGQVRAAADFDQDGYGDLAVSVPDEDVDGRNDQGAVVVLWGSSSGLAGGTTMPNQTPGQFNSFGKDLATGDFNGDGTPDLAAINGGKTFVYRGAITRTGVTGSVTEHDQESTSFSADTLIAGKVTPDSATDLVITGVVAGVEHPTTDAWFIRGGSTLTPGEALRFDASQWSSRPDGVIADFDQDGYGDIAIGNPADSGYQGAVVIWPGGATGPGSTSQRLTQATADVAGTPEASDWFGDSISAADVTGDGFPDLAVGVRGEAIGTVEWAGGMHLFKGGADGLAGTGSQWFSRATSGIPGAVTADDNFGGTVRLRDTDGDGHADLFVGGNLSSLRLPGTDSGLTTTGLTQLDDNESPHGFLQ
ncbi:MAG: FG-GAP repeat protein [Streptomyces sp.]|uniref:FG-GAP repeat protein n=1 Tax=Streptomyces sp. TaxID=1931 RepID=UPI003D6B70AF